MKTRNYVKKLNLEYARLTENYRRVIGESVARAGSAAELSRQIGANTRYVVNALNSRGVGSGLKTLRQICNKIADLDEPLDIEKSSNGKS